jgi:hypothetical protein
MFFATLQNDSSAVSKPSEPFIRMLGLHRKMTDK